MRGSKKTELKKITGLGEFLIEGAVLALMTGFTLPASVIASAGEEFMSLPDPADPLPGLYWSLRLAMGIFVIWPAVFYCLSGERIRRIFLIAYRILCPVFFLDSLLFSGAIGRITPDFIMVANQRYVFTDYLVNAAAIAAVVAVVLFLSKKRERIIWVIALAMFSSVLAGGIISAKKISDTYANVGEVARKYGEKPEIRLSSKGKNVVVIMMDRMLSNYLPYIMNERPELVDRFDGFTWYPDSLSFGGQTICGSPGVYGGYEYTPAAMNERKGELLRDKHNEALKVMPLAFLNKGYRVTVCDPTFAGYQWIPDLDIYEEYPEINKYITKGNLNADLSVSDKETELHRRNTFAFGLFRCAPNFLRKLVYDDGDYYSALIYDKSVIGNMTYQKREGHSKSVGVDADFINAYNALDALPDITFADEETPDSFLMMSNDTAHDAILLSEPDYVPASYVDNTAYDAGHRFRYDDSGNGIKIVDVNNAISYQCNMAAFLKLGEWLDRLRELGVYDDTRIIIVSDHGGELWQDSALTVKGDNYLGDGSSYLYDTNAFNCMLMVKDFGSHGFTRDDSLMSNADVPALAMEGLMEKVNPITGRELSLGVRDWEECSVLYTGKVFESDNTGNTFPTGAWFTVRGSIFDRKSWTAPKVH